MTFDLENARAADEVLPYPLDAKEIWVSGKGQMHINPPNAPSIFFTLSDLCEFRNIFHGQAAEIERLRADYDKLKSSLLVIDGCKKLMNQAARIDELEADNQNLVTLNKSLMNNDWILRDNNRKYRKRAQKAELLNKELKADLEQSERVVEARLDVIDQQAAKIRELEDVHKRSGVKYAKIINELRSSVYANIPGLKKQWDEILNAPANGKIGPDADAKPHCWRITEERKAALWHAIKVLKENDIMEEPEEHLWDEEVTVLQAMMKEAGQ